MKHSSLLTTLALSLASSFARAETIDSLERDLDLIKGSDEMICTSIDTVTGETFTLTGRKWTAASRALAACEEAKNEQYGENFGQCLILNCEPLIVTF